MVDSKTFWDKMAPKYAESQMRSVDDYEHTLARTLSYLTPQMRVHGTHNGVVGGTGVAA